jgi:hypothetical protein
MDSNANQPKPTLSSGLSLIEKAQELRWTLQLATAVLFADLVLVWRTGKGLAHWSIQADVLLANSGFVLVSILFFGILMSIVIPLAAEFFRSVGWWLLTSIPWPSWMQTDRDYSRPVGGVSPSELRDYAYKNDDRFLLDIVAAHKDKEKKSISENLAAGQIVFGVLALGLANYFPSVLGIHAVTLLREVPATFNSVGELAIAVAFLLALLAIKTTWFSIDALDWIEYPPLYGEIESARRERLGIR